MIIDRIEVLDFRNIEGSLEFGPGLNILYGDNAQGKTSWLEAIYALGTGKSFRTNSLKDCIRFDSPSAIVRGRVSRSSVSRELQLAILESAKDLYVNAKRETSARYLGNLDVFVFSLEDIGIIRGEPTERRRFLDRGVCTLMPSFAGTLSDYAHIIKQKNRLLTDAQESGDPRKYHAEIEVWNEQLLELATTIHKARSRYVTRLDETLSRFEYGRALFGAETIEVRYRSSLEGKGDLSHYRDLLRERLELRLPAEIAAGHCLIGPHRDDLEIRSNGRDVARFASSGQQKSALFILDLGQIFLYNSLYEENPVLLIDDIDAELDRGRIEALLTELEGKIQTFISTSRRGIAERYQDRASLFLVEGGRVANRRLHPEIAESPDQHLQDVEVETSQAADHNLI